MADRSSYTSLRKARTKRGREADYELVDQPSFLSLVSMVPVVKPERKESQKCVTSILSPARMRWDLLISFLAIWNCFYVPFSVAFMPDTEYLPLIVTDLFIDLFYLFDIVVYARSTYVDWDTGEEVTNTRKILRHYFTSGKLVIDIVAAVPFDLITAISGEHSNMRLMMLSKGIRILRLSKIIIFWQTKSRVKSTIKLGQLLFFFLAYLHLIACLWYLLTSNFEAYRPPALYIDKEAELYTTSVLREYAYSLYMAVYMLTAAEIGPRTSWERLFAGCAVLLGQLFQAFMFGEIAVVLFNLNRKSEELVSISDAVATTMINMRLRHPLREKISKFILMMQGSLTRHREYEEFFEVLPPSLKREIRSFLFEQPLDKNKILRNHAQLQSSMLRRLGTRYCQPEENVILQGESANEFYIIAGGKCAVYVLDEQRVQSLVKFIGEGAHFGEIALVFPTLRTATVMAVDYPALAVVKRDGFCFLCKKYPKFARMMQMSALRYKDKWKLFLLETLKRCRYFTYISDKVLSEVIYALPQKMYEAGSLLFKDGDDSKEIAFVVEGEVEIFTNVNDTFLKLVPNSQTHSPENSIFGRRVHTQATTPTRLGFSFGQKAVRYASRLTIELLGPGSVICPYSTLLGGKVQFYAKARKATLVMYLPHTLLFSLLSKVREMRDITGEFKSDLMSKKLKRAQLLAGDYEKRISDKVSKSLWESKMKLKRCILSKLLEKRSLRAKGFSEVWAMTTKLKAILEAEEKKDARMLEKLRRGVAPESQHLIDAYNLLDISEVENPLLTQFAVETTKLSQSIIRTHDHISSLSLSYQALLTHRSALQDNLSDVKQFTSLLSRLNSVRNSSWSPWFNV